MLFEPSVLTSQKAHTAGAFFVLSFVYRRKTIRKTLYQLLLYAQPKGVFWLRIDQLAPSCKGHARAYGAKKEQSKRSKSLILKA